MRISDWSSDVCSSDLRQRQTERLNEKRRRGGCSAPASVNEAPAQPCPGHQRAASCNAHQTFTSTDRPRATLCRFSRTAKRSEEHTSELQSLMRISYAVFCLKKKNTIMKTSYKHITVNNNNIPLTKHNNAIIENKTTRTNN